MTSATIIGVAYYLAYRNPVDFNLSHAVAILLLVILVPFMMWYQSVQARESAGAR